MRGLRKGCTTFECPFCIVHYGKKKLVHVSADNKEASHEDTPCPEFTEVLTDKSNVEAFLKKCQSIKTN